MSRKNITKKNDRQIELLDEFTSVFSIFRLSIGAIGWLAESKDLYLKFLEKYKYIVEIQTSVIEDVVKIDKSILKMLDYKDKNRLIKSSIIELAKLIIINVKDITDALPELSEIRASSSYKILKVLRNASAHNNKVFFEKGKYRERVIKQLPIRWRNKTIDITSENQDVFDDLHFSPADIFVIAEEISILVRDIRNKKSI